MAHITRTLTADECIVAISNAVASLRLRTYIGERSSNSLRSAPAYVGAPDINITHVAANQAREAKRSA